MQAYVDYILQVRDYDCEQLLLAGTMNARNKTSSSCPHNNSWKELALRSACLAAKDLCQKSKAELTAAIVTAAVLNKFTNRHHHFHSNEHFVQVRAEVTSHMQRFFMEHKQEGELMAAFEAFTISIDELTMEFTLYFHMLYYDASTNTYIIRRLMTEQHDELLELYYHMTTVFAATALQGAKIRIEVLFILSGGSVSWQPDMKHIQLSFDYMTILKTLLLHDNSSPVLRC